MTEKAKREARGSVGFSVLQAAHARMVFGRRVRVLAECLSARIPPGSAVLDIGCGDGTIGNLLAERGSEVSIEGVEFAPRPQCRIPCRPFDGAVLPFADGSFDVCLFVDVLHHTDDPTILLREARRMTRRFVLIKDHLSENGFDFKTLQFMDWVGNRLMACVCRTTIRAARNGKRASRIAGSPSPSGPAKCRCTLFRFRCSLAAPCISSPSWKRCNRAAMPVVIPPARERQSPDWPAPPAS